MIELKSTIKNIIKYNYIKQEKKQQTIHIGYGIDNNFARCCATSIASFCINNPPKNFYFHIVINDFSEINKQKMQLLAKQYKVNINLYEIDISLLEKYNLPTKTHWPISMYFRFILPLVLDSVDNLIYIDADIFCLNNANDLFNIYLENNIIGAVAEPKEEYCKRLGLKNHLYFNSGLLIIDIIKWNKYNTLEKLLYNIKNNPKIFQCPDQDALNLILTKNIKYIPQKFNWFNWSNTWTKETQKDIILIHFGSNPKPWHSTWYINPHCNQYNINIYKNYEKLTPWKDEPLQVPVKRQDIRCYSNWLIKHGKILKGLKWYLKYLNTKFNKQK